MSVPPAPTTATPAAIPTLGTVPAAGRRRGNVDAAQNGIDRHPRMEFIIHSWLRLP